MASDTSLVFNLIAKDHVSKALGPVAAKLSAFGSGISKAMMGVGVAAPHVAAATTAALALASAGASAAVGLGGFAAAVKPQLQSATDAMALYEKTLENTGQKAKAVAKENAQYEAALKKMPKATREFTKELIGAKDEYGKWSDALAKSTMPIFTNGLKAARAALPALTPAVNSVTGVLKSFSKEIVKLAGSKQFASWIKDFSKNAGTTLADAITIAKNLISGVSDILKLFAPNASTATGSLVALTGAFSAWTAGLGDSAGFAKFQELAATSGPALANLGTALGGLVVSLAPFMGSTAIIVDLFARIITNTPAPVITALGQAFVIATVAARAWAATTAVGTAAQAASKVVASAWNSVFMTGVRLKALDAAALVRSTAATVASTAATVASRVATVAVSAATKAWAATQWVLNAAMAANPIGLVVIAIIALIAIVVIAYKKNETFRRVCQAAWAGIKVAIGAVVSWIKTNVPPAWNAIMSAARRVWSWIKSAWGSIKSAIVNPFKSAASAVKSVWGKLASWFSGLKARFVGIGGGIVDGLKSGIMAKWNQVISWVQGQIARLPAAAKKVLGIASPSKVFRKLGMHVAEGMAAGIKGGWKAVSRALKHGLDDVKKQYAAAKARLKAAKDEMSQIASSVRDAFRSGTIVERGGTFQEIAMSLREQIDSSRAMFDTLKALKKQGLSARILRQLAEAGPEALGQAQSILSSGKGGIRELNALQKSLDSIAKKAGTFTAETAYRDAVKSASREMKALSKVIKELTRAIKVAKSGGSSRAASAAAAGPLPIGAPIATSSTSSAPIELRFSDGEVGRFLARLLRDEVRRSGRGDVQIALGR